MPRFMPPTLSRGRQVCSVWTTSPFTNVAESLLDKVRSAELKLETDVVATLLASRDHISDLLKHAAEGCRVPSLEVHERGQEIIRRQKAHFESGTPAIPSQCRII